jgi:hypothetical protein
LTIDLQLSTTHPLLLILAPLRELRFLFPELGLKHSISFNYNTFSKKQLARQFDTNETSASVWVKHEPQKGFRVAMGLSKGTILVERVNVRPRATGRSQTCERPRATERSYESERSCGTERSGAIERAEASEWSRAMERFQARARRFGGEGFGQCCCVKSGAFVVE